jgi:PAS domain S-box-containing protein
MKKNQHMSIELALKGCKDTEFPVQLDCLCVNSMLRITLTDITKIKQAEAALHEAETQAFISNERLQLEKIQEQARESLTKIASRVPGVLYQFRLHADGSSCFPYASEGIREIYRLSPDEVIEDSSKVFSIIYPDDFDGVKASINQSAQHRIPWQHEYRVKFGDGTIRWLYGNAIPEQEFAIDGSLLWHGFITDITERKKSDDTAKLHLEALAHVTRLRLMGEMASGIAHEVNQPLTAISTYAQVSINLLNTENPDLIKIKEVLSKTQQQSLRAGRIINRMKEFGKSHSYQHLSTDINDLIQDVNDFCMIELKQNNVTLNFELTNDLPPVFVDCIQIEQVIINLVRNSIEALHDLPKNTGKITIQSNLAANNHIQISVIDNGPGIDKEQQQKILTPFHTTKINGTGMGLSISRSLIEAHGGSFYFDSELGKGSIFYFTLPVETAAERERALANTNPFNLSDLE